MKGFSIASLGALALVVSVPFVSKLPFISNSLSGVAVAQTPARQAAIQLNLVAEKKAVQQGNAKWLPMQGNVAVRPGDVIRYTVTGKNTSDRPVKNLAVTQPIPKQTKYVLNSASVAQNNGVKIVYSIDNGKTFVEKPTVQVKGADGKLENRPAPAEVYTHVRWRFGSAITPKTAVQASYQVQVR